MICLWHFLLTTINTSLSGSSHVPIWIVFTFACINSWYFIQFVSGGMNHYYFLYIKESFFLIMALTANFPLSSWVFMLLLQFLSHVFEHSALELILRYTDLRESKDSRLAFEALKYLAALLCHKKFSIEFINMKGLQVSFVNCFSK